MLTEPGDIDRAELKAVLERHWGLHGPALEYLPVGFGSHHWRALDSRGALRFVSVDDLKAGFQAGPDTDSAFAALDRAFRTAAVLRHEAELEFVVAPLLDGEGQVIRRVSDRYAVTVSPFVEGETSTWGPYESVADRRRMGGVLARLHAATERIPADLPRREDLELPARAALAEALLELNRRWTSGPLAEPARRLLEASAREVEALLHEYDELAARVREHTDRWVVTHGEPHRANVIRGPDGGVHLVDWDTTLIAPRERDLHFVLDRDLTGWDEYGAASLDREAMQLYEHWWVLADISVPIHLFRGPHEQTEDTAAWLENLAASLPKS